VEADREREGAEPPGRPAEARRSASGELIGAAPGLLRIAASAWWRSAEWYVGSLRKLIGAPLRGAPLPPAPRREAGREAEPPPSQQSLRERGAELLRRSADVHYDEELHPAYARMLDELTPDEARILRLLAREGPQPAVDVRGGLPFASELIAQGLSMIGAEAGCRHPERVHAYLNNLNRLGLIWFSREPVRDRNRYQVLEAQPEATEALRKAGRLGRTVRRSVRLTAFGEDFCATCLPAGE